MYDTYLVSNNIGSHNPSKEQQFIDLYIEYLDSIENYLKKNYSTFIDGNDKFDFYGVQSYNGIIHVQFQEITDRGFIEIKVVKLVNL
ncbi:hypothetical protein ACQ29_gp141 [Escherichia phage PBECO4]|uniref:Uncharacterized protein n=1 Tax=Escherichia phage PBECO4 TaxID=1273738 RepID=L7TK53_9CAUD|nr:hypothetical protein ACQ29_gp141 [Escherichia phage PBECO4]AGC34821.1 hypothetical protein [Escherichia phage PBECO4]